MQQLEDATSDGVFVGIGTIATELDRLDLIDEMTQSQLAEEVGVTRQTIIAVERARYFPTLVPSI